MNGQDTAALRRSSTTASGCEVFIEEESCSDEEQGHTPETIALLAIENLHAVDSQTQATLPATLGKLTPPMIVEGDHITVPNGVPGAGNGEAAFKFSCSGAVPELLLSFEVRAPNGNDDSFRIAMDRGEHSRIVMLSGFVVLSVSLTRKVSPLQESTTTR